MCLAWWMYNPYGILYALIVFLYRCLIPTGYIINLNDFNKNICVNGKKEMDSRKK